MKTIAEFLKRAADAAPLSGRKGKLATLRLPRPLDELQLRVHQLEEHVSSKMLEVGEWEPTETLCVTRLTNDGDFVIDVGANVGYYSLLFHRLVGDAGQVVAIEPDATNFSLLTANLREHDANNVKTVHALAGDHEGTGRVFRSDWNFGDHRTYPSAGQTRGSKRRMITLDSVVEAEQRAPSLIKIDCQGAEISILRGLQRTLDSQQLRPGVMIVEFWPFGLDASGGCAEELLGLLPQNYHLWDIGRWKGRPTRTSVEALVELTNSSLTAESGLFTNILLISERQDELTRIMDGLCA